MQSGTWDWTGVAYVKVLVHLVDEFVLGISERAHQITIGRLAKGQKQGCMITYALVLPSVPWAVVQVQAPVQAAKCQLVYLEIRTILRPCQDSRCDDRPNASLTVAFNVDDLLGTRGTNTIDGGLV
jgi:hypothetical protein